MLFIFSSGSQYAAWGKLHDGMLSKQNNTQPNCSPYGNNCINIQRQRRQTKIFTIVSYLRKVELQVIFIFCFMLLFIVRILYHEYAFTSLIKNIFKNDSKEFSQIIPFIQWIFRVDFLSILWFDLLAPRESWESFPATQFESISCSAHSLLYGPILTSVHDC